MPILRPSRRDILKMSAAAPAFALTATPAIADLSAPASGQSAGFFKFEIGDAKLTVVSDGHFVRPSKSDAVNASPTEIVAFLDAHYQDVFDHYMHTNHVVIELGDAKVLVDVGSGHRFFPTTGRLLDNLAAAGISEDDITHVALTHAHPDHVWGIRDDFDEAIFPDAEYLIGAAEFDYWMGDDLVHFVEPEEQSIVLGAVNSLTAAEPQLTLVQDKHEIAPGITMIDSAGHTVGHMSLLIESNGQSLMVIGDALRDTFMSFEKPEWYAGVDMDPELTVSTRKRILDMASADRIAVLGYHFPFPGVGHVMAENGNYRYIPALWKWNQG